MSSLAVGTGSRATADTAVALGNDSATTAKSAVVNGVNYGEFAGSEPTAVVSVGDDKLKRQIVNVAAGEVSKTSTDAVNGSQLYAVAGQVSANLHQIQANSDRINANASQIRANNSQINANARQIQANNNQIATNRANINKLSAGLADTNKRIDRVAGDVAKNRKRASAASALAVANIPHATHGGYSALGVGVGRHAGQQSIAVRYSKMTDSTKWIVSASVAVNTQNEVSFGAGLTRQW